MLMMSEQEDGKNVTALAFPKMPLDTLPCSPGKGSSCFIACATPLTGEKKGNREEGE